jgi:hypothetical protein
MGMRRNSPEAVSLLDFDRSFSSEQLPKARIRAAK